MVAQILVKPLCHHRPLVFLLSKINYSQKYFYFLCAAFHSILHLSQQTYPSAPKKPALTNIALPGAIGPPHQLQFDIRICITMFPTL